MHRRIDENIGDAACSPAPYFDFGAQIQIGLTDTAPACTRAILGGGQVYSDCVEAAIYLTGQARQRVIWGVGISRKNVRHYSFDILEGACQLIGSRNWDVPRCTYVPCVSAMSPLFDAPASPVHDVVLYLHAGKSAGIPLPPEVPMMMNNDGTLAQALAFLASGATVVTNSYHGTYWGMCLGRRVLCLPFSNKFRQFRENPVFADPADWPAHIAAAEVRWGVLDEARSLNRAFYERVMNLG
jgi:hypothetical protein